MNATTLVNALRRHRDGLAARWCKQFADNRVLARNHAVVLRPALVLALIDEVVGLLVTEARNDIPRRHRGRDLVELAPFPENVAICIDVFQAGAQVIGAFVVENAGPFAAWGIEARNAYLSELDAVFHILVHREIEAVCEHRLDLTALTPLVESLRVRAAGLACLPTDEVCDN